MTVASPGAGTAPDPGPATGTTAAEIAILPALQDNYIFVLHNGQQAVVVDPAVGDPVVAWLRRQGLRLTALLHTHHHADHIGGAAALLQAWPDVRVFAAAADRDRIPHQTDGVRQGDVFSLLGREVRVLEVPGHTRAHVAYHLPALAPDQHEELFCGDTLFAAGCGRLFEGTAEQMHTSLARLMALPASTRVWCAHEYTEANLRWALSEAPGQAAIADRLLAVRARRQAGLPTIPSTLAEERRTNLFVQARDGRELAALRESKNDWRP
ncbi:MAG: hydroxyacylglutathione hydrolase [Cyanobacteriota bacterium]|nr:hydroxyacylglutathione hydrolase [Cyanobacteriota bacterium]